MEKNQKIITEETAKQLVNLLAKAPKITAAKSLEFVKKPVYQLRNSQILAGITGTIGLILFALGIENLIGTIPKLSSPFVEITLGLVLLAISGLFLKKLI